MSLLAKICGAVPVEARDGIRLVSGAPWEVSAIRDLPQFLRALSALLPSGTILYLECVSAQDVIEFLAIKSAKNTSKVALGTIWPRPNFFHLELTQTNMMELAELCERHATFEVCIHLHAYKDGRVVLEWHDAFTQPLLLAGDIPENRVAEFCRLLNCQYQRTLIP